MYQSWLECSGILMVWWLSASWMNSLLVFLIRKRKLCFGKSVNLHYLHWTVRRVRTTTMVMPRKRHEDYDWSSRITAVHVQSSYIVAKSMLNDHFQVVTIFKENAWRHIDIEVAWQNWKQRGTVSINPKGWTLFLKWPLLKTISSEMLTDYKNKLLKWAATNTTQFREESVLDLSAM